VTAAFDVAVVGSGPSGALAAAALIRGGARVLMLDVANDDDRYRPLIPDLPFWEIRRTATEQRRFFLGDRLEGVPSGSVRVGAQLTPPRQFVTRDADAWLPTTGDGFEPMQSLALGGLGAAWGAACFTYSEAELRRIGIFEPGFGRLYDRVAEWVGVSADPEDDAARRGFAGVAGCQPPLDLDSTCGSVWQAYLRQRESLLARGLALGRTPLAVLSRDLGDRRANPYFDMDFWSDSRRSVFRPRYLVEALEREPGFRLARGCLVQRFAPCEEGVEVRCRDVRTGTAVAHRARRLLLCAGAIGSARIALHSLGLVGVPVPMLCNPYVYLPCVNPRRLGRPAGDRRHSLSQLVAMFAPPDDPHDVVSVQLYGYRSLLLFKLVKELPLPPWAGLLVARLLVDSLVIAGIHHSDAPHAGKSVRLASPAGDGFPAMHFDFTPTPEETRLRRSRERALSRLLLRLGVLPFGRIDPGAASSIHYAGTLPLREAGDEPFATLPDGRLRGAPRVFVGDSSTWRHLPAKGLTFTLMANAIRVAEHLLRDLGREPR
jgi:choline dehydrogenase-like flavoprotein